uniref:Uncharacterized protein n=1 Tax=Nothobranchius furzeri TaxID=105023 RepID=A0A8C6KJT6_NOTFU
MPGIFPTRLTTILSLLFPVRTFTALLMVMLSRLTPFTSTSLSPTVSPACAADTHATQRDQQKQRSHVNKSAHLHMSTEMQTLCSSHLQSCRPQLC